MSCLWARYWVCIGEKYCVKIIVKRLCIPSSRPPALLKRRRLGSKPLILDRYFSNEEEETLRAQTNMQIPLALGILHCSFYSLKQNWTSLVRMFIVFISWKRLQSTWVLIPTYVHHLPLRLSPSPPPGLRHTIYLVLLVTSSRLQHDNQSNQTAGQQRWRRTY